MKAKPRLCCFGQIHEGSGVTKVDRVAEEFDVVGNADGDGEVVISNSGKEVEIMFVNTAVFGDKKVWLVELEPWDD